MTRKRKSVIAAAGLAAAYVVLVFFGVSALLTRMVPDRLAGILGRPVAIDHIRVNPLSLSVTVRGFSVMEADGSAPFVRFDRLYVNAEILSLLKRGLVVKRLSLDGPEINLVRLDETTFNVSDLLKGGNTAPEEPTDVPAKDGARPFYFAVADIAVNNGRVTYRDLPAGADHAVEPLTFRLPLISNFPKQHDRFSHPALSCSVNGAALTADVKTKPFKDSLETVLDLGLTGLALPRYAAHLPRERVHLSVDRGLLDLTARIAFRKEGGKSVVEAEGALHLSDLALTDHHGGNLFSLTGLHISLLPSPVTDKRMHLGEVRIDSPTLDVVRDADGAFNLTGLVTPDDGPADETTTQEADDAPSPALVIDRLVLEKGLIRFTDHDAPGQKNPAVTVLSGLSVTAAPLSTVDGQVSRVDLSARINDAAPLRLGTDLTLSPLSVDSEAALSDFSLAWLQPYIPEPIRLGLTGGRFETEGHLRLTMPADQPMALTVTADAAVRDFASVDRDTNEPFLTWDDVSLDNLSLAMEPLRVAIDAVTLNRLKQRILIDEKGALNLSTIAGTKEASPKTPEEKGDENASSAVVPVRIGTLALNGTEVRFRDRSLTPPFATRLALKTLTVTGLTSEDFKAADVKAKGTLDGTAPLEISGRINPLSKDLFVDLDLGLGNVDMTAFSTYTGKYVGRAIEKGKLSLDVDYHIKEKAITAGNRLVLDQFTLGKTVDSPDALPLPLGLAVSLLKDRKGVIDIDLPVSGRTDDPEFRWGKALLKSLVNLITKAATSPFALVGSLVGGGEELRFVEFDAGRAVVDEPGEQKLSALRTLLVERPGLSMEVMGYADPKTDGPALAARRLDRSIRTAVLQRSARSAKAVDDKALSAMALTAEDRLWALRLLYKKEVIDPGDDPSAKPLSDPALTEGEMEAALLSRMIVTDGDLRMLAVRRARQTMTRLLADPAVSAERVFLVEPEAPLAVPDDGFRPGRVELGLK
ncbi:DUF748 domain-containing protein [Desulfatiferula olefinivorans]